MEHRKFYSLIFCAFFMFALLGNTAALVRTAGSGPPAPHEVFVDMTGIGHNFTEDYWDINVFNNSAWENDLVDNHTSWLNNTWNIKWINMGDFQFISLAFLNKTSYSDNEPGIWTAPAQFWGMHLKFGSSEMLIGNLLAAWFGFEDSDGDRNYNGSEDLTPFFFLSAYTAETRNVAGINKMPDVLYGPLTRTVNGDTVKFTWWYNYTNTMFYVPKIDHSNNSFSAGFNYRDPGTYLAGSSIVGVLDYLYYGYELEINMNNGTAVMRYNYRQGPISVMKSWNGTDWVLIGPGDPGYLPDDFALCYGNWAFVISGTDPYSLTTPNGININASMNYSGLTEVSTTVGGNDMFDFKFSQKPDYTVYQLGNTSNSGTYSVRYASLDIKNNREFVDFVSGMSILVGPFAELVGAYIINQTNSFTNGITFEDAFNALDTDEAAALFITCYPEYGQYMGGLLDHDPTFVAYFNPELTGTGSSIPGYSLSSLAAGALAALLIIGVSVFRGNRRKGNIDL